MISVVACLYWFKVRSRRVSEYEDIVGPSMDNQSDYKDIGERDKEGRDPDLRLSSCMQLGV